MPESFETLIAGWDGDGVVIRHDQPTGTWIFVALHDLSRRMASGGTRMRTYETPADGLRDAMRLAHGMTCKWAGVDLDFGGGKAVLAVPRPLVGEERVGLLHRYARLVESLRGAFGTGQDLGTTPADMVTMAEETRYVHGVDRLTGQTDDPGPYTAEGVFAGIRSAVRQVYGSPELAGKRVLVQGVGGVGGPLVQLLAGVGAEVLVCDLDAARAEQVAAAVGGRAVAAEDLFGTPCEVFAPCATGAILDRETIPRLACRIVAGSANNQLAEVADAQRLHERGILYAPDYLINAGGAIALSLPTLGVVERAPRLARVREIGDTLAGVFAEAAERGESPLAAAERRVERVLARRRAEPTRRVAELVH
jgi:leucine dehydrogenase